MIRVLGDRIKASRERLGWSQMDLAEKVGQSDKMAVSKWERGLVMPSAGNLDALADALARAQRERRALSDIQAAGGAFWDLPEPVIHQHLHRLLGDYRIAIPADRKAPWAIVPKPARRSLKP